MRWDTAWNLLPVLLICVDRLLSPNHVLLDRFRTGIPPICLILWRLHLCWLGYGRLHHIHFTVVLRAALHIRLAWLSAGLGMRHLDHTTLVLLYFDASIHKRSAVGSGCCLRPRGLPSRRYVIFTIGVIRQYLQYGQLFLHVLSESSANRCMADLEQAMGVGLEGPAITIASKTIRIRLCSMAEFRPVWVVQEARLIGLHIDCTTMVLVYFIKLILTDRLDSRFGELCRTFLIMNRWSLWALWPLLIFVFIRMIALRLRLLSARYTPEPLTAVGSYKVLLALLER